MSEANQPSTPPVFRDRISPVEAPASIGSRTPQQAEQKQQAVIGYHERRAAELSQYVDTQPSPQEVGQRLESVGEAVAATSQKLEQAARVENVVSESGLNRFGLVRQLMGKRTEAQQANDIAEASAALVEAEALKTQTQADLEAVQMYGEAYLAKQTDPSKVKELVEANRRGGPLAISAEMTRALKQQDQIREQVRFYEERGYDVSVDKMLPLDVYIEMKRVGREPFFQEKDADQLILMMTAINEVALGYADSNGLKVEQRRLGDAYELGQRITDGVTGRDTRMAFDFTRRRRQREYVSTNEVGYYAIGAAQLEDFFNRNRITEGEERVPYVLAYTAGALANGVVEFLGPISRDLLADTLPCAKTEMIRRDGEWVEETQPPKPRGLGSFITPQDAYSSWGVQREGTTDRGLAEVMKRAGDIVRSLDNKFRERRVDYRLIDRFDVAKVVDPPVLNPRQTV